jgi:hypothetical protein
MFPGDGSGENGKETAAARTLRRWDYLKYTKAGW